MQRTLGLGLVTVTIVCATLVIPIFASPQVGAQPSPLFAWTSSAPFTNIYLRGISCPTTSLCVTVSGQTIYTSASPNDNLQTWSSIDLPITFDLNDVSCASANLCVAVGMSSTIFVSTNPTGGPSAWVPTTVQWIGLFAGSPSNYIFGVSCPSTTLCILVGNAPEIVVSTNPTGGTQSWTAKVLQNPPYGFINYAFMQAISCPTTSLCVIMGDAGYIYVSSDPGGGGSTFSTENIDPNEIFVNGTWSDHLTGISCASPDLCAVVENGGNIIVSTNPTGGAGAWTITPISNGVLETVVCPTNSECIAIGTQAYVSTNPAGGPSAWSGEPIADPNRNHSSIACVSQNQCIAVGADILVGNRYLQPSTPCVLPGVENQPFQLSLSPQYGIAPYSWKITQGSLPPGLSLRSGGLISGVPTSSGVSEIAVQVTDASSPGDQVDEDLEIPILSPDSQSYVLADSLGNIETFTSIGDAFCPGSANQLDSPAVSLATTRTPSNTYWLATSNGSIYSFGDAPYYGSSGQINPSQPPSPTNSVNPPIDNVVSMTTTPDGHGYWLATSNGSIYSFGDAPYYGRWSAQGLVVSIITG